jgi:hypothetical protein
MPGENFSAYIAYENETDYSETSTKFRRRGRILPAYIAYENGTDYSETSIELRCREEFFLLTLPMKMEQSVLKRL